MKKLIIILIAAFALALSACGVQGPFTETLYEAAPTPADAPELLIDQSFGEGDSFERVEYACGYASIALSLPEGWHSETVEYSEETGEFGIDFWPEGSGGKKLRLHYYGGMFGVCGTGLTEAEAELPGTGKLRIGYYDGSETPSFISFYDAPGGYALTNELGSGWSAHEDEIEKILSSIVLDEGVIRVSEAENIASAALDANYDYLRTDFDMESGIFTVKFVEMGGTSNGEVSMDKEGNILE